MTAPVPYEMVHLRIARQGDTDIVAPDAPPPEMRTWSSYATFVPGTLKEVKARIAPLTLNFPPDYIDVPGGVWVLLGYNDLERTVAALRAGG